MEVLLVAQGARIRTDPAVALAALVSKHARLPAPFSNMHWVAALRVVGCPGSDRISCGHLVSSETIADCCFIMVRIVCLLVTEKSTIAIRPRYAHPYRHISPKE